jgi:hypothetical protein
MIYNPIENHGLRTDAELVAYARGMHPECKHGRVVSGLTAYLRLVSVVELWHNMDDYLADMPPLHCVDFA